MYMSGLLFRQINSHVVNAVPLQDVDLRPVKGKDICAEAFANIFLVAKKRSGKTSVIFKLLKECSGKNTRIIVFCSTVYKDKNWIGIRSYFEKKGMDIECFTDIYDNGVNNIEAIIEELGTDTAEHEEEVPTDPADRLLMLLGNKSPKKEKKQKKSQCLAPDCVMVFDDSRHQLRDPILQSLLKKNRHYRLKCIISSQWLNDMRPEQRKQIDLWMIFRGMPFKKLEEIAKDADVSMDVKQFWKIYRKATKKQYSFLYIDTSDGHMRQNFNNLIEFKESEE